MTDVQEKVTRAAQTKAKKEKTCEQCKRWADVKKRMRIAEVLASAVKGFQEKLESKDFKPTVAEYLKLVQMEQEYEQELDAPREIQVTWVEATPSFEDSK